MSKRPRQEVKAPVPVLLEAPECPPNPHYANAADDGLPALAYGPNIGLLLVTQSSADPVAALSQIAEADTLVHAMERQHRAGVLEKYYEMAQRSETAAASVRTSVLWEAAAVIAQMFIVCIDSGMTPEASSRRASDRLRDWGLSADADLRNAVREAILVHAVAARGDGMDESDVQPLEPVLRHEEGDFGSTRPLFGATSGTSYLHGEWEAGYTPRNREVYRYPADAGDGATVLDPALLAEARLSLRRPAFPDRMYPRASGGMHGGAGYARAFALAAQWDETENVECRLAELQERATHALVQTGTS